MTRAPAARRRTFREIVLAILPDDTREEVAATFDFGLRIAKLTGTEPNDTALFLFMVRQVKKEWERVEAVLREGA